MDDKFKRKNLHFFFNHNLNSNIKIVNPDNPVSNPIEIKGRGFFANFSQKNLIKKDLRGYPIKQSEENSTLNNNINNNKDVNHLICSSQPVELNRDIILDQISQMIDQKTKNNNKDNSMGLNLNNQNNIIKTQKGDFLSQENQNLKLNKNIGGRCFQNTKITSIHSIKFNNNSNNNNNNIEKNNNYELNTYEYNPIARSVQSFSYNEEKNIKSKMEDFHIIIDRYMNSNNKGYFSILDGHGIGCQEPIKYATTRLPNIFSNFLNSTNYNIEKSFIYSFQKIDDELKCYSQIENCGSTVTIIYIDKELNIIYGANIGDSKSIIINRNKTYKNLTTEHKVESNIKENERIKKLGGIIFNGRLFGQLALSRALGDFSLKNNGLISTPSIHKHKFNEDDIYIIIASDGIWDVLNEDDISFFCIENCNLNCDELGKLIIKKAIEKGSEDNISCILIQLNDIVN